MNATITDVNAKPWAAQIRRDTPHTTAEWETVGEAGLARRAAAMLHDLMLDHGIAEPTAYRDHLMHGGEVSADDWTRFRVLDQRPFARTLAGLDQAAHLLKRMRQPGSGVPVATQLRVAVYDDPTRSHVMHVQDAGLEPDDRLLAVQAVACLLGSQEAPYRHRAHVSIRVGGWLITADMPEDDTPAIVKGD
jgi:hypothetical protein